MSDELNLPSRALREGEENNLPGGVSIPVRQRDESAMYEGSTPMTVYSMVKERTLTTINILWKLSLIALMSYGINLLSSLNQMGAVLPKTLKSIVEEPFLKAIRSEPLVLPTWDEPSSQPSIKGSGKSKARSGL